MRGGGGGSTGGGGDMTKAVYDTNDDGIVDNSEKLEGSTKAEVQNHAPQAHTHSATDITSGVFNSLLFPRIFISGTDIYYYKDNLGTSIFWSNDAEKTTSSTSYVKKKEIKLTYTPDTTLKIYWEMYSYVGVLCYATVYRNGIAVGTEKTDTSGSYTAKIDTVSGWSNGDLLQLYVKATSPRTAYVRNFRILCTLGGCFNNPVNQDP